MKKILAVLLLGFLSACGYANYSEVVEYSGYRYTALVEAEHLLGQNIGAYGGSPNSQYEANSWAMDVCKTKYSNCVLTFEGSRNVYPGVYSSSSSASSYSSSSYSNPKPRLYYDSSTGGMRECSYDPGATGNCLSFKPYNASLYDKNTLFYNPSTGTMQPCMGIVTVNGKCSAYGIFNHAKATTDKGQLYYDPRNKKMTTCSFVTVAGKCTMYDLVPNSWAKNDGGFRMTDPSNPYIKRVPRTPQDSIDVGMRMITGQCTLGLNC